MNNADQVIIKNEIVFNDISNYILQKYGQPNKTRILQSTKVLDNNISRTVNTKWSMTIKNIPIEICLVSGLASISIDVIDEQYCLKNQQIVPMNNEQTKFFIRNYGILEKESTSHFEDNRVYGPNEKIPTLFYYYISLSKFKELCFG